MDLQHLTVNSKRFRQTGYSANGVATFRSLPTGQDEPLEALPQISISTREPKNGRGAKTVIRGIFPRQIGTDENSMPVYRNGRVELSIVHTPGARTVDRTQLVEFLQHILATNDLVTAMRDGEPIL